MSILRAENISLNLSLDGTVFENLSISVREGEKVIIRGTQSEKNMLLPILSGMTEPNRGKIFLQDEELKYFINTKYFEKRKIISIISGTLSPIANLSVRENLELPLRFDRTVSETERQDITENMLEILNLKSKSGFRPDRLNSDEKKLLTAAAGLKSTTRLILADDTLEKMDDESLQMLKWLISYRIEEDNPAVIFFFKKKVLFSDEKFTSYITENGKLKKILSMEED